MDLIARAYDNDDGDTDGEGAENPEGPKAAVEAPTGPKGQARRDGAAETSTSSEYYSSSSSESEAEAMDDDSASSASGVESEGETARAAGMIDSLIRSKGWEALNDVGSDEEGDTNASAPRTKNEVEPESPQPLPADLVRDADTLLEAGKVRWLPPLLAFPSLLRFSRPFLSLSLCV